MDSIIELQELRKRVLQKCEERKKAVDSVYTSYEKCRRQSVISERMYPQWKVK